jgi:diadenosine tetraphosphate (Ap4A) HIT family hydrolase
MVDFSKFLVKQYKHWGVYVHENQNYLGRCVVWCDRADAKQLTDAREEGRDELFLILKELQNASTAAFGGEWFNFAFLGNETPHLHCHFIPRYSTEKEFEGTTFKDERWGHNYRTDHAFTTTSELLEKVRQKMAGALANEVMDRGAKP